MEPDNDARPAFDAIGDHPILGAPPAPPPAATRSAAEPGNLAITSVIAQGVMATLALVGFLWLAKGLLLPVVLGICLAYLLSTPVALLQRWVRLSHGPATVLILLAALALLGAAGWTVYGEAVKFGSKSSEYRERLAQLVDQAVTPVRALEQAADNLTPKQDPEVRPDAAPLRDPLNPEAERPVSVRLVRDKAELLPQLLSYAGGLAGLAEDVAVTLFVAVLALSSWKMLRNKLLALAGREQYAVTLQILGGIHEGIQGYLWGTFLISIIVAAGTGVLLLAFNVPYALLWSLWAGLLAYVPYVGVPLAIAPPLLIAYCNGSSASDVAMIAGIYAVFRGIEGQYICSLVLSSHVDMNPLAILVSLLFWGWLWGPVGLIVAVPLTMTVIVLCDHIPGFTFVSELLGGEDHTVSGLIVTPGAPEPAAEPPSSGNLPAAAPPMPSRLIT